MLANKVHGEVKTSRGNNTETMAMDFQKKDFCFQQGQDLVVG